MLSIEKKNIAQDCSLRQCLISSRAETSKKKVFVAQIGAQMTVCSNVVKHSLKLACFHLF